MIYSFCVNNAHHHSMERWSAPLSLKCKVSEVFPTPKHVLWLLNKAPKSVIFICTYRSNPHMARSAIVFLLKAADREPTRAVSLLPPYPGPSKRSPYCCGHGNEMHGHNPSLPRFHRLPTALPWSPGLQFTADHRAEVGGHQREGTKQCVIYIPQS